MLSPSHPKHNDIMAYMASGLATDQQGVKEQLETIDFFTPERAAKLNVTDAGWTRPRWTPCGHSPSITAFWGKGRKKA